MEETTKSHSLSIPVAIVIAGAFIAGAVYFSNNNSGTQVVGTGANVPNEAQQQAPETASLDSVRSVTEDDHIKGNPNASVKIVEYSDMECPFCKRFHDTMNQVIDEYGASGEVAWAYRHFPLEQLHPVKAHTEAVASECAAEQGGNDAFWKFTDRFFEVTPSNNQTEIETVIPQIVREIGLDETAFQSCLESGRYDDRIEADIANAVETGGRGTPWSILIAPNGEKFPINGAQPYKTIKQLIELALNEI